MFISYVQISTIIYIGIFCVFIDNCNAGLKVKIAYFVV